MYLLVSVPSCHGCPAPSAAHDARRGSVKIIMRLTSLNRKSGSAPDLPIAGIPLLPGLYRQCQHEMEKRASG
jgi:hypothetical protein